MTSGLEEVMKMFEDKDNSSVPISFEEFKRRLRKHLYEKDDYKWNKDKDGRIIEEIKYNNIWVNLFKTR